MHSEEDNNKTEQKRPLLGSNLPSVLPFHHQQQQTTVIVQGGDGEENNCCLGFWMGCLFGIFGLCCVFCVRNKASYMKGWVVPFIISTIIVIVLIILLATGVLFAAHNA